MGPRRRAKNGLDYFEQDQEAYRAGFEAALRRECQGKTVEQAADCLKWWHPDTWDSEPFRRGFERGRAYLEARLRYSAAIP